MPVTKSELMYLSVGLAVGGAVGANWSKIKPMLDVMLGPAAEGFEDAYGDLVGSLASRMEAFKDAAAEGNYAQQESAAETDVQPASDVQSATVEQETVKQETDEPSKPAQTNGRAAAANGRQPPVSHQYARA